MASDRSAGDDAVALMYHAQTGPGSPEAGQDTHYSVSMAAFEAQLDVLTAHGGGACARDWLDGSGDGATLITFDDGHLSNYTLAFPALHERRLRADFFVNPGRVGSGGFADWAQLREMADAGMSIQSHGWNHRYFTALSAAELRDDLMRSRHAIEERVGHAVTLLAPPGGRAPAHLADVARECGYEHVLGSRPGRCRRGSRGLLPRMAVTAALDTGTLEGWLSGRGIARAQVRYAALGLAKRVLGDGGYERLRSGVLSRLRGRA